jgi:protein-tyrosine phosphatase
MSSRPYRVTVVCTGNICRSPMGEFVLRERFEAAGLGDRVVVDSAGTHSWEVGNPADPRTLAVLSRNGHADFGGRDHVARRFERTWFDEVDLVLAADRGHLGVLSGMAADPSRVRLLRSFDPQAEDDEVPDPYGHPDEQYRQVLAMLQDAAPGLVDEIRQRLA